MVRKVTNFKINELKDPKFLFTSYVTFEQGGVVKGWEIVNAHDSVAILIYNKDQNCFVLVKQFRAAVYANSNGVLDGVAIELCAGLIDKNLTIKEIAKEEIEEECGYKVELYTIQKVTKVNNSVGFAGTRQTIFYVEVTDSMIVNAGGGIENEEIEVIHLPVSQASEFMFNESITKTTGLLFAIMWWMDTKS